MFKIESPQMHLHNIIELAESVSTMCDRVDDGLCETNALKPQTLENIAKASALTKPLQQFWDFPFQHGPTEDLRLQAGPSVPATENTLQAHLFFENVEGAYFRDA